MRRAETPASRAQRRSTRSACRSATVTSGRPRRRTNDAPTDTAEGKQFYSLRKKTVEPVFGIIKEAIGFRRFLLRGQETVELESTLMSTSYKLKRLFKLGRCLTTD